MGTQTMKTWYPHEQYFSQAWYKNTFLVRRPTQIGKANTNERDWNNIHDTGCNFTCIAMLVGIDPARLASALSQQSFFYADYAAPATMLTGATGGLVWDANAPNEHIRSVRLSQLWHPRMKRRVTAVVRYKGYAKAKRHATALNVVKRARQRSQHVICGPFEHAHLVAGEIGDDYFVWDPDDTSVSVEDSLAGRFRLKQLFAENANEAIEFCFYSVEFLIEEPTP